MGSIVFFVSLLTLLAAGVLSREIPRNEDNDITLSPDGVGATPFVRAYNRRAEKKIKKQVEALKQLKCKSIREKVYTKDHIPESHNVYLDGANFEIFPEVLSVRKCDPNCSYCQTEKLEFRGVEWIKGFTDVFTCQAIKPDMKKRYTIRAKDRQTGETNYFPIRLPNEKCKCKLRPRNL